MPFDTNTWLQSRTATLAQKLQSVGTAALHGGLPSASLKDGALHLDRLEKTVPDGADTLVLKLYGDMAPVRITDVLLEVDHRLGFAEAFSDLRTGAPCRDRIGLLTVLLANGVNLGLSKMADACHGRSFWELLRIAKWHVREETYARALALIVEAQSALPMARFWGAGETSSSDGQHFPAGGAGEALNVVNARYGNEPGLAAYSHVSDQYAPFATQIIPATAHEAPYILGGLLQNEAGQRIKVSLIRENWPDILRLAASMATGELIPSQILRKLAAYPRQNSLALALREVGRIERSIFILDWLSDLDLQRRTQMGLNKGEAHHALKRAISFNRRGEIRDRTSEAQHDRIAGLNLLAAIIVYWNTWKLGEIVARLAKAGEALPSDLLAHVSPLGWEHITLTGEYHWPA